MHSVTTDAKPVRPATALERVAARLPWRTSAWVALTRALRLPRTTQRLGIDTYAVDTYSAWEVDAGRSPLPQWEYLQLTGEQLALLEAAVRVDYVCSLQSSTARNYIVDGMSLYDMFRLAAHDQDLARECVSVAHRLWEIFADDRMKSNFATR